VAKLKKLERANADALASAEAKLLSTTADATALAQEKAGAQAEITRLQKELAKLKQRLADLERANANVTLPSNVKSFDFDWQLFQFSLKLVPT